MPKYEIRDEQDYRPVPDLWHGANVLLRDGHQNPAGSLYKWMGAALMLAATVEGFCQTLGPMVFGDEWHGKEGDRGLERKPPMEKLKQLAKRAGVKFDRGLDPWRAINALFIARDGFMHPKPATKSVAGVMECDADDADTVNRHHAQEVWRLRFPILDESEISRTAAAVKGGMTTIWIAFGKNERDLFRQGISLGSIRRVE